MATIDEAAEEVARRLLDMRGGYDGRRELFEHDFEVARDAAVLMSQRLNKSIDIDEFFERSIEFQARATEVAQGHNQIFIAVGYAAFFALWSAMASSISELAMLAAGGLMAISLIVFIGWTVAGMVLIKLTTESTARLYASGPVDFHARMVAVQANTFRQRTKMMRWWPSVLATAGGTALIAAAVLSCSAAASIIAKSHSDHNRLPTVAHTLVKPVVRASEHGPPKR